MMHIKYTLQDGVLNIIDCPSTFNKMCIDAIKLKEKTSNIKKLILSDNVEIIADDTFKDSLIEEIILPNSLIRIGNHAFHGCKNLKYIIIPEKVKDIGNYAFAFSGLENISLPESLESLGEASFICTCIQSIRLPNNIKKIERETFKYCFFLKNIELPNELIVIDERAFEGCKKLHYINIPESTEEIGSHCFETSGLKRIEINAPIKKISKNCFYMTKQLKSIKLPESLIEIDDCAFNTCESLNKICIPKKVKYIGKNAFENSNLTEIELPKSLKKIDTEAFKECKKLASVTIQTGLLEIGKRAFIDSGIKEIRLPVTLDILGEDALKCKSLEKIYLNDNGTEIAIDTVQKLIINNKHNKLLLKDILEPKFSFYDNGKYITYDSHKTLKTYKHSSVIMNDQSFFINLWYWSRKNKFLPHSVVIEEMPIEDISLFYKNKNCDKWAEILNSINISTTHNKRSLFKLCYVLGVFQENGSKRDEAIKFIKDNIINSMDEFEIHDRFDGFDISNRFNPMYAEFFMKYFKDNINFMYDNKAQIDYTIASYNRFNEVKLAYPNKLVNTNRQSDILLPAHVIDVMKKVIYKRVDENNKDFADIIGRYGYKQYQFDVLQDIYNKGKNINEEDLKIFISADTVKNKEQISYELLAKDNPIGAVLGDITNCCQVIGGAGETCVKYGISMPNSKFMTFNYNDMIIGQSWVWYDEKSGVICLDNIEIPHRYNSMIKNNIDIQESFIECLKRVGNNFIVEMENKGLHVSKVTIGKGYNDIKYILDKSFKIDDDPKKLSDYYGYRDSFIQYEIINKGKR